ncbi:hypothetical protein OGX80_10920 [Citrobacter sp. CK194]|uniref:Uncharacterized protein n=2 Tax=Citrobacter koseri TaxID=545 RepID=A0A3S4J7I0_CITKO|nr:MULTISPECIES: hypothetical protein [Citrobacter]MBJ8875033.1 hypothetical protein [Citrobacter koseri]MBJ9236349.1 hypothetical protein [Citrobacter koseri]MDM3025325.1 hypothetical protein [Citrobacter sp. CK194]VEB94253.1 Uncharacterised protein [Citrobacter koseri]
MERNLKPLIVLALFVFIFFGLLDFFWKTPMLAFGAISLILTVLAGTNYVAINLQKLVWKKGKEPIDIWTICSVTISVVAIPFAYVYGGASGLETVIYGILVVCLSIIVCWDTKNGKNNNNEIKKYIEISEINESEKEIVVTTRIRKQKAP